MYEENPKVQKIDKEIIYSSEESSIEALKIDKVIYHQNEVKKRDKDFIPLPLLFIFNYLRRLNPANFHQYSSSLKKKSSLLG